MGSRRPLLAVSLSYVVGLLAGYKLPYIPVHAIWLTAAAVMVAAVWFYIRRKNIVFLLYGMLFLMGFGLFQYRFYIASDGLQEWEGKEVQLSGIIIQQIDVAEAKNTYLFLTDSAKAKIRLTIYDLLAQKNANLKYGDIIEVVGILQLPDVRRNPGGLDYRAYLKVDGIYHTMTVDWGDIKLLGHRERYLFREVLEMLKQRIIDDIDGFMQYPENTLLKGIVLGYTADMPDIVRSAYSAAGLAHILAVSGMNVAFIPLLIYAITGGIHHRIWIRDIVALMIIWVYAVIANLSPSVLRASIMLTIALLGRLLNRQSDTINNLTLAALVILIINPLYIYDLGFILSFSATAGLLLFYNPIKATIESFMPKTLAELCAVTLAAQIGVVPIIIYGFNQLSLLSLFINVVVGPIMGLIFISGLIMAVIALFVSPLAVLLGFPLYIILRSMDIFTLGIAEIPWASIVMASPPIMLVALYYIILGIFFLGKQLNKKVLNAMISAAMIAVLVISISVNRESGRLEIVFLDVGQGDSIFIRTPSGKNILIDGGNRIDYLADGFDAGKSIVVPFLRHKGIGRIHLLLYSHADSDHLGGLWAVLQNMKVDILAYSVESKSFLQTAAQKGVKTKALFSGDRVDMGDGVYLDVLYPAFDGSANDGNERSLVLKLRYNDFTLLLPGDIESETEHMMVDSGISLNSMVIKVPHHGSMTSSSPDFIAAVKPKVAVISVGKNNFGQPADDVIKRYKTLGSMVYRTDECGAVIMSTDGRSLRIETMIKP